MQGSRSHESIKHISLCRRHLDPLVSLTICNTCLHGLRCVRIKLVSRWSAETPHPPGRPCRDRPQPTRPCGGCFARSHVRNPVWNLNWNCADSRTDPRTEPCTELCTPYCYPRQLFTSCPLPALYVLSPAGTLRAIPARSLRAIPFQHFTCYPRQVFASYSLPALYVLSPPGLCELSPSALHVLSPPGLCEASPSSTLRAIPASSLRAV